MMRMLALQTTFLVVAAAVVFFWLTYALTGPRKLKQADILHVLQYGWMLRTGALILALAPPVLMACFVVLVRWQNTGTLALAGIAFLATSVVGGLLLFEVEGIQIALTEEGVTRYARWGTPICVKWVDVERVSYSRLNRWFIIASVLRSIKVSRHLVGIAAFAAIVRRKVGAERCASAAAALDAVK